MTKKELRIALYIWLPTIIIIRTVLGLILGQEALHALGEGLSLAIGGASIWFGIYRAWKDPLTKLEVDVKELDPNKAYIFSTTVPLSPEQFDEFAKRIKQMLPNKDNIIANGKSLEVTAKK